ncbi:MAG: insulinase family protein [Bacteroidales bacterium]|nr:insulinase family protein [Bacteroidales bacterium]MDY0197547.1 insulinase family protein [Tenuifilaceae bacterium]
MKYFRFSAILIALLSVFNLLNAQQGGINWNNPLPTDPKVTIGELDNGMRYYIRSNSEPKNRAEFYIIHNVGAILENDDQDGLAHFTEHMAFNGTKNYPKKGVLNFLENIGVKFGHNVNAFTAQDVTAYNLSNVPLTREGIIDSALLILNDWSSYIAFEDEEIDAERGVIREEWRTRRTAEWRAQQEKMKYLFNGSKYGERDVIGSIDVINNHKYETLKRFYMEWYRPDLQAIIIVGDFDSEMMEQKVIDLFSKIPSRENKSPRPDFEVPNHKEPLVGVFTDSEITRTMIEVYYKHPVVPDDQKNLGYYKEKLVQNLYAQMLNARYNELVQKDNPPFVVAYSYFGDLVRTKSAYVIMANARENEPVRAMKSMLEENYRLKQHGFTKTELDRAKADLLRNIENSYKEKDKVKSGNLVWEYFSNFTDNEPIPGIEFEYMLSQSLVPSISIEELNAKVNKWITDENMVIFITAPEKEKGNIPDKDGILAIYKEVKESTLEPYEDNVSTEPLVSQQPKAGKVAKEIKSDKLETTEWVLSNGVKVIIKPTDFKEDEILLSAYSPGGSSLVKESDVPSAQMVSAISMMSGVGNHSRIDLEKMLAGKMVSVMPYVSENEEGFNGNCSPDDLEEMMQLVYLYFTNPRFDESAYNAYMSRIKAVLQNAGSSPSSVFRDSISYMLSDRNYRRRPMNINLLDEVDFNALQSIYKDRFADASDFTFVLVGNIDIDKLKPLVETYLGSLPNIERKETWKDNQIRFPKGETKNPFTFAMQVPKTTCFVAYQAPADYNLQNMLYFDAIEHVLDLRYTETIREEEGGSYGVSSSVNLSKSPINQVIVTMYFDTDPDKAEHLVGIIHKEFAKIIKEGTKEEDLNKAREYFLKSRQERLRENRFWSSAIREYYSNGVDIVNGYEDMVKKLNTATVKKAASEFFKKPNMLEVIMSPEK